MYEMVNNEVWQIYDDLNKTDEFVIDNSIKLERTEDMNIMAQITYSAFNSWF